MRRHGSVGSAAAGAICCCSAVVDDEDEEVVEEEEEDDVGVVGDETDSAALSCSFWHFSCFFPTVAVFAGFPVGGGGGDDGCSSAGPRCTQENRVCGMRDRLQFVKPQYKISIR